VGNAGRGVVAVTAIRNSAEFLSGAGYDGEELCKSTTVQHTPLNAPWRGEKHESDKTACYEYVRRKRYNGQSARLCEVVKAVYGDDYTNNQYLRLSRFIERVDWLEREAITNDFVRVDATPACFKEPRHLNSSKAKRENTGRQGDGDVNDETGGETGESPDTEATKGPKERLSSVLESNTLVGSDKRRNDSLRELWRWRQSVDESYNVFRTTKWWKEDNEYLITPLLSRFNDSQRARATKERLYTALQRSHAGNSVGVLLTLTVDPKRVDGHTAALEKLHDSWEKLRSRLKYQFGQSVDMAKALEWQDSGMPHFHIALFGVRKVPAGESETGEPTLSEAELRQWWDTDYNVGSQVTVQSVHERGDRWLLHDGDQRVSLRYYMGKASRRLVELASMSEAELREVVTDGDLSLWKQALYWVHEERYVTCSPDLKETTDNEYPPVAQWEYVGTMRFSQIPESVRNNAIVSNLSRPPPATSSAKSTTTTG
jgi:hypothetical protein